MNDAAQHEYNRKFVARWLARRPSLRPAYEERIVAAATAAHAGAIGGPENLPVDAVNESIVREERPVLFVRQDRFDKVNATLNGVEARELVGILERAEPRLQPMLPLIGRIDVAGFPGNVDFVGTGWFVAETIVVTNRHVARLIAQQNGARWVFTRGVSGREISASLNTVREFDDLSPDQSRVFRIEEVLYIEKLDGPNDIAFLRVARRTDGTKPVFIPILKTDLENNAPVITVGYPAKASRNIIPDQALMRELFRDRYDIKRAAPGLILATERAGSTEHDCTTLGGNSGSVILDPSGSAAGLHYAGLYRQANYAVPASALRQYVEREGWRQPVEVATRPPARAAEETGAPARPASEVVVTIPLTIKVSLGEAMAPASPDTGSRALPASVSEVETALRQFWISRPAGVLAARVGFSDANEAIGDEPFIAASVLASQLPQVAASAPSHWLGIPVRYFPAEVSEQVDQMPELESVDSIAYDDDQRKGPDFSFATVNEDMTVRAHVGPEYSWDELQAFLSEARKSLVSAIYEFHAPHIRDALAERLEAGTSLTLVMDNATFAKERRPGTAFDRIATFDEWADAYAGQFSRIVAPEGRKGLISDAYHIKVTVRDDGTFWLSSGNWKEHSSPVISQEQRDEIADEDLPGNREWHVVISNATLSRRFRSHILQDFAQSEKLGGGPLPQKGKAKEVEVPLEETLVLERRAPSEILEPLRIHRPVKVKPLLTPDREGAVFCEAVLELIASAKNSLLFQIPYIAMPSNPRADRGYIDELIQALTHKLKTLKEARVLLRSGGSKYSSPTHVAWYFKSKGVDIAERLRRIENHHTKGMIVDGKRVLLGSHNWSKPGVTLNRDASLLFDDEELAAYYARAFRIDWARSTPIGPKRYVKAETMIDSGDSILVPRFERVDLQELRE